MANSMKRRYRSKSKFTVYKTVKPIMFFLFLAYAVSLVIPFLWMFISSFKSIGEFNEGNIFGFPTEWTFSNLGEVMSMEIEGNTILSMLGMSVLTTLLGTLINVGLSTVAAYVVAKYRFPGRRLILAVAIFTMVVPIVGTLPAQVRMLETFHMDNSIVGVLFLYSGCFGFNFIMLHSSFTTISWSYAEAAQIDGAGRFTIMFRIMFPLARGTIISICILQAIVLWNDYSTPRLFMPNTPTLAVGLQSLQTAASKQLPLVFSAVMVAVIPILVLFAFFQKTIIRNTVAGGLKG